MSVVNLDDEQSRAERFAEALGGRTLTWLAAQVGVAVSTMSSYARGKPPHGLVAAAIAETLGVDLFWYLTGRFPAGTEAALPSMQIQRLSSDGTPNGVCCIDPAALSMSDDLVAKSYAVTISGNAMSPTIPAGAEVVIVPAGEITEGDVYYLNLNGRAVLRRIQFLAGGKFLAVCDNPAFTGESFDTLDPGMVLGRVLAYARFV